MSIQLSAAPALLAQAGELHAQGQLQEAAAIYLRVLNTEPENFDALHMLGVYALQIGDLQAAYDLITQALAIDPDHANAHMHLGAVLQAQGQLDPALDAVQRALALDADNLAALSNYGSLLSLFKRPGEALAPLQRVLDINPDHADALNNLGYALVELQRHDEALAVLDRALKLRPDYALSHYNRGNALHLLNRLDEALRCYDTALALAPGLADAQFTLGLCRLLNGDLAGGWPQYEWRWRKPSMAGRFPDYPQPIWRGNTTLQGKTILVYHEQGLGDTLHMCRYVPLLAAQGARVVLQVQPALKPLLAKLSGAAHVIASGEALPPFDLHCPLLSLPLAFGTTLETIPAELPYVQADPALEASWQARLQPAAGKRVGLVWSGNPSHDNDRNRSIPLEQMRQLLAPGLDLISLQRDLSEVDRALLASDTRISQYADLQSDFAETAALVAQMDLVICVDTAIAHLAGAMGKPVWLLLPFAPDWRWLLEREDSPWYPGMRLFRQRRAGDWDEVLQRVAKELQHPAPIN